MERCCWSSRNRWPGGEKMEKPALLGRLGKGGAVVARAVTGGARHRDRALPTLEHLHLPRHPLLQATGGRGADSRPCLPRATAVLCSSLHFISHFCSLHICFGQEGDLVEIKIKERAVRAHFFHPE